MARLTWSLVVGLLVALPAIVFAVQQREASAAQARVERGQYLVKSRGCND